MIVRRLFIYLSLLLSLTIVSNPVLSRDIEEFLLDKPIALTTLRLDSTEGIPVDADSLSRRWTFVSMGYTSCPDVCPFTLGNLAAVEAAIAEEKDETAAPTFLFVSVDPERDNIENLTDYLRHFSDTFVGATGSRNEIDRFIETVQAFYRLGRKDKDGHYLVDHSAYVYLIDPKARVAAKFPPPLNPKEMKRIFREIRNRFAMETKG